MPKQLPSKSAWSPQRRGGLEIGILTLKEALEIFPYMTDEDLYGAFYIENDGYIDPNGITTKLARLAKEMASRYELACG